jgi:hypothetical protein
MDTSSTNKRAQAGVENFAHALAELSQRHYQRDGSDLLESLADDELARKQYARLLGVMVKQPFVTRTLWRTQQEVV